MNLSALSNSEFINRLQGSGLGLRLGPFAFRIKSKLEQVAQGLSVLYPDYPLLEIGEFADFTVNIDRGYGLRRWIAPQAIFRFDGLEPFTPLPQNHAFPLLEWAMNWCISTQAHQYLILHSAVVEREGSAVIMPAPPGSGKSTLCAGLICRGWRLLSDELALLSLKNSELMPLGRPISLKNQSIEIIQEFSESVVLNVETPDTTKGRVTHMKVPTEQLERLNETVKPRWVIFPKYVTGSQPQLVRRSKANSMLELGRNSFNYMVLGRAGFETLAKVVDTSDCYDFQYSNLDDAVTTFDNLLRQRAM